MTARRQAEEAVRVAKEQAKAAKEQAEVARRAEAIGRGDGNWHPSDVHGTPAQVVDALGRYAEAGAQRGYLQVLDLADLDHLDLIAAEVAPQLR